MSTLKKKSLVQASPDIVVMTLSRREAAAWITRGARHIVVSPLGDKDPEVKLTRTAIERGAVPTLPWEQSKITVNLGVQRSADRHAIVQQILKESGLDSKRQLTQTLKSVLEELLTNSIYHAYRSSGKEKYSRTTAVDLTTSERVSVELSTTDSGCLVVVRDQGGHLEFEKIGRALERCYETETQIESKEGGAGLGLYMIFEAVSHLKIVNVPGKMTTFSCWIATSRHFDPGVFSFHYFNGSSK